MFYPLVSAFLLYLAFPNLLILTGFWPMGWIFAVPLFFALEQKKWRERLKIGVVFGIGSYALLLSWLSLLNFLGYACLVLLFSLQAILFCLLCGEYRHTILKNFPLLEKGWRTIFPPALWVMTEYLRTVMLGGFSCGIGHSQSFFTPVIQLASVTGAYGISFVLILFNWSLYRIASYPPQRFFFSLMAAGTIAMVSCFGYFSNLTRSGQIPPQRKIDISVLQPNINPKVKWDKNSLEEVLNIHMDLTRKCLLKQRPDLIVWPETAIPDDFLKEASMREKITVLAREAKTYLLLGAALYEGDRYYNSAVLLDGKGVVLDIYRKKYLIPFSEYLPLSRTLSFMRHVFHLNVVDFYKGKSPGLMTLNRKTSNEEAYQQKFAVAICSEDGYPSLFRKLVSNQAGFVVVILNDAWFAQKTALLMHGQLSIMRAVENKIPIIRAANSGWSCLVNTDGSGGPFLINDNFLNSQGTRTWTVVPSVRGTFYTRYGDIFAVFCLSFVIMNFILVPHRKRKKEV